MGLESLEELRLVELGGRKISPTVIHTGIIADDREELLKYAVRRIISQVFLHNLTDTGIRRRNFTTSFPPPIPSAFCPYTCRVPQSCFTP